MVACRYIDDIRLILEAVEAGWRWTGKKLEFRHEWKDQDEAEEVSDTKKTARVLQAIMNSIDDNLEFTMETHKDFANLRLPTLDTEIWVRKDGVILYSFFEKGVSAKEVMRQNTALSENTKVSSLAQDLIRRMKHTSILLPMTQRVEVINEFTKKMLSSGYDKEQTKSVTVAALKGYEKAVERHEAGVRPLHLKAKYGLSGRNRKKLLGNHHGSRRRPERKVRKMLKEQRSTKVNQ